MTKTVKATATDAALDFRYKAQWPTDPYTHVVLQPGESKTVTIPSGTAVLVDPVDGPAGAVIENVGTDSLTERRGGDPDYVAPPGDVKTYAFTETRDGVTITGYYAH